MVRIEVGEVGDRAVAGQRHLAARFVNAQVRIGGRFNLQHVSYLAAAPDTPGRRVAAESAASQAERRPHPRRCALPHHASRPVRRVLLERACQAMPYANCAVRQYLTQPKISVVSVPLQQRETKSR